jgi:predicted metalloenzyme YecM
LESVLAERAKQDGSVWPPPRPPPTNQEKPVIVEKKASSKTRTNTTFAKAKGTAPKASEPEAAEPQLATTKPADPAKNAARNKKKREREKRKKLARTFLTTLREQVPRFLQAVLSALDRLGVNDSSYPADHVCWRMESIEEYTDLVAALRAATEDTRLLIESDIGGRSIATFELLEPIACGDGRTLNVVEIPSPKEGRPYKRGLEHVEFVIHDHVSGNEPMSDEAQRHVLEEFMDTNSEVNWNKKAIVKPLNPDVSLQVELEDFGVCSIKFHLMPLSKVIDYEKDHAIVS